MQNLTLSLASLFSKGFPLKAWGYGRRSSNVFESVLRFSDTGRLINLFLHPVVDVGGGLVHSLYT
jgi:hypothetical protein